MSFTYATVRRTRADRTRTAQDLPLAAGVRACLWLALLWQAAAYARRYGLRLWTCYFCRPADEPIAEMLPR
jgi:hypothetical protein